MNKKFCDICNNEIPNHDDLRYINITKVGDQPQLGRSEDKPVMVEKECCVNCSMKVKAFIGNLCSVKEHA